MMGQLPDLQRIDHALRTLIYLLNQVPYIQTVASCSGHPDEPWRKWGKGFLAVEPVQDFDAFFQLLNEVKIKLNGFNKQIFERAKKLDAQSLYTSGEPLIKIYLSFGLGVAKKHQTNSMVVLNSLLESVQRFLNKSQNKPPVIKDPMEGIDLLINWFHSTPYVQPHITSRRLPASAFFQARWDKESCRWCWNLVKHLHKALSDVLRLLNFQGQVPPFFVNGHFYISPILIPLHSKRTRQDHQKIWKLLEQAIYQLIPSLEDTAPPPECMAEPSPPTDISIEGRAQTDWYLLAYHAQQGNRQAYLYLYDEIKQYIQEILARDDDIGEKEKIENILLSELLNNLERYYSEPITFKKWIIGTIRGIRSGKQVFTACAHALEAYLHRYGDEVRVKQSEVSGEWVVIEFATNQHMTIDARRRKIKAAIEVFLKDHEETPDILHAACWAYKSLRGGIQNVPESLFEKMLQHPQTIASLSALDGLAERSQDACEKWKYYKRVLNEFTISNVPRLSWYLGIHEEMLSLACQNRSLVSDEKLDELIEHYLKTYLVYCRNRKQAFQWAYTEAVKWRIKLGVREEKALKTLELAYERLKEKEEQKWMKKSKESLEEAQKRIRRIQESVMSR